MVVSIAVKETFVTAEQIEESKREISVRRELLLKNLVTELQEHHACAWEVCEEFQEMDALFLELQAVIKKYAKK